MFDLLLVRVLCEYEEDEGERVTRILLFLSIIYHCLAGGMDLDGCLLVTGHTVYDFGRYIGKL